MIEELIPDKIFCQNKMCEDFYIKGVYCFHDDRLKSLVLESNWVKQYDDDTNFFGLIDLNASSISEKIIFDNLSKVFDLKVRRTTIFCGIDKISDTWHTDMEEKMFCQTLCYQEDLYQDDGGAIRLKCLDGLERYFYPKNGSVIIINHNNNVEHKVDNILSKVKRIVINSIFDLK
jgi:hypothetical protein